MCQRQCTEFSITKEEFEGLSKYKYSCCDDSPLTKYILHPFWDYCTKFMPVWLAPNVITLLGFMFTISQAVLITTYDPNFNNNSIPSWVWFYLAFAQFMAQTLDGIDGKQARRLGKGSPLGEIFDHSVDAWSAHIIVSEKLRPFRSRATKTMEFS